MAHRQELSAVTLRQLFANDAQRGSTFHLESTGFYFDYSKNLINAKTLTLLEALVDETGVLSRRDAMFAGDHINVSEGRAVLHVALRMHSRRVVDC